MSLKLLYPGSISLQGFSTVSLHRLSGCCRYMSNKSDWLEGSPSEVNTSTLLFSDIGGPFMITFPLKKL